MDYATLVGYSAAIVSTLSFLPQVIKAWKTKSTKDVSLTMYIAFIAGIVLWLIYGIMLNSWPMIAANIVTITLAVIILVMKFRYG